MPLPEDVTEMGPEFTTGDVLGVIAEATKDVPPFLECRWPGCHRLAFMRGGKVVSANGLCWIHDTREV
jgi:hypothetical protein